MCRRVQGEQVTCLLPLCWLSHEISPRSLTHRPRLGPPVVSDSQPSNSVPRGVSLSSSAPVTGTGGLWSAYRPRPRLAFTQVIGPTTGGGQLSSPLDYAKSADAIAAGSRARCPSQSRPHGSRSTPSARSFACARVLGVEHQRTMGALWGRD